MLHRHPSRLPLLFLALAALAGCSPKSEVAFAVTVPPETPAGTTLRLMGSDPSLSGEGVELAYQGNFVYSARVQLPRNEALSYSVRMTAPAVQVPLDTAGAVVPARSFTAHDKEAQEAFTVERWGPETGNPQPQTVFVVTVPDFTPTDATIYIAGNQDALGGWDPGAVKLDKALEHNYTLSASFPADTSLEFKATRGGWDTVEKGPEGEEVANHALRTSGGFERFSFTVGTWADINNKPPPQVLTGNIQYLRDVTPKDSTLKKRDVIIWLPPDYDTTTRHYPVLYMHDGQNLMDASTAFAGEWGVDETAQDLVTSKAVEPLIIVGIYNTADRIADYTQVPDPKYAGGNADAYGKFLVEELKPLIDSKYRTKPEAQYTGLAGSSLGGLVSLYLGMKYPDTFTRLGVMSPSVWWANKDIVSKVNALSAKPPLTLWEDIGTAEGTSGAADEETVGDARLLRDALVAKGWVLDDDLKYFEDPGAKHNEAAWSKRFGSVLKYLYPYQVP